MKSLQQQQFINDLLVESFEGLDRFDRELLDLEKGQGGSETLHSIFRIIHTLKGTSGCLGLRKIQKLAHAGESLLDLIRNNKLGVTSEIISAVLRMSDSLRDMLKVLEAQGVEGEQGHEDLIELLHKLQTPPDKQEAVNAAFGLFEDDPPAAPSADAASATTAVPAPAAEPASSAEPPGAGVFAEEAPAPLPQEATAVTAAAVPAPVSAAAPAASTRKSSKQAAATTAAAAAAPAAASHPSAADSGIRVDISLLDRLMNLVGELVLARNQIVQNTTSNGADGALGAAAQRLNIITTELQEGVMKTRMQPIAGIWAKYPRIVRDVSQELGKQVRLEMEGQETELDRTIIEAIKDPLTHIIRNSIDHGVESPEKRRAAGKAEEGLLHLRAFHEGGQVNIEVSDDGAGINAAKVKAKALEKDLITAEQASRMTEREAMNLIFLPGLSTAEKITNVSGRGVGMDVVKTNIEKIGGSVDVQSSLGEGTTLRIKIPLTLAIIPALIITSSTERFAIPQVSLVELVRLDNDQVHKSIEFIFDAPVYRLRGKLLPLVYLNQVLKLDATASRSKAANIVVLKAGEQQFGLVVDDVNDTQEIVVKPLGKHLKGLPVFAGATIMGDGRVALILDVFGLAQHSHVVAQNSESSSGDTAGAGHGTAAENADPQSILIFSLGTENRLAMQLSSVGRLEKFPQEKVEREGPREVVQYRGQIMPLIHVAEVLGLRSNRAPGAELPVVVYRNGNRNLGLVVGKIEDIIDDSVVLENQRQRAGILGSAVIQGRVTEMIDVPSIVGASRV